MKLLILAQKVDINDGVLGFFHDWLKEFAEHCEKLTVICLYKGEYDLPDNVQVLSLGKEKIDSRSRVRDNNIVNRQSLIVNRARGVLIKFSYIKNFYKYIWQERKEYDSVFVHMNQVYVVLGGLFWRIWKKRIALWYTHKQVTPSLRVAEKLTHEIFTASKESFRLKSKKVKVMGHGIEIEKFTKEDNRESNNEFKVIQIGRISPIKNQRLLVEAIGVFKKEHSDLNIKVDMYGPVVDAKDKTYEDDLLVLIKSNGLDSIVNLRGSVANKDIPDIIHNYDLSINLCPTGGMDKAVLESIAAGVLTLVYNKTFGSEYKGFENDFILNDDSPEELAQKIYNITKFDELKKNKFREEMFNRVKERHSLSGLINRIIKIINK